MKKFIAIWQGDMVSDLGTTAFMWLVPVLAVSQLGVADDQLGLLFASVWAIPALLSASLGVFADRANTYVAMHVCNLIRFATMAAVVWALWAGHLSLVFLALMMLLTDMASSYYDSMMVATTPRIVPGPKLARANSLVEAAMTVTGTAGEALGGVLLSAFGAVAVVALNAFSYLYSSLSLLLFVGKRDLYPPEPEERQRVWREARQPFRQRARRHFGEVRESWRVWRGFPVLVRLTACSVLFNVAVVLIWTLLTPYALETLGLSEWLFGLLSVASLVFGVLSPVFINLTLHHLGAWWVPAIGYSLGIFGLLLVTFSYLAGPWAFVLLSLGMGLMDFAAIMALVIERTARQALVPRGKLAGVSGLVRSLMWISEPLVAAVTGVLSTYVLGRLWTMRLSLVFAAAALAVFIWTRVPEFAKVDAMLGRKLEEKMETFTPSHAGAHQGHSGTYVEEHPYLDR